MTEHHSQFVSTPLWPHQVDGLEHLDGKPKALCAWDMGTGKTLFGLERDQRLRAQFEGRTKSGTFKTLVVAPTGTHKGWIRTVRENLGDIPIARLDRTNARSRNLFLDPPAGNSNRDVPVGLSKNESGLWLMHWEALALMQDQLREFGFHHIILDECHRIKNANTARTKAAKSLGNPLITDMSGSPMTNKPKDLWSILNHLYPKDHYYKSFWRFVHTYLEMSRPNGYWEFGPPNERWIEEGFPNMQPFYHYVALDDVIKDMPQINDITIDVELEGRQLELYRSMERDWLAWVDDMEIDDFSPMTAPIILARLRRLQQFAIACMYQDGYRKIRKKNSISGEVEIVETPVFKMQRPSAKLDALEDIVRDNDTQKFVVFSQFKEPFYMLREVLHKGRNPIECVIYTGDQDDVEREKALDQFINGDARVICLTYGAGGEGIDGLQKVSRNIVLIDEDWAPESNRQAIARLRRAGFAFSSLNVVRLRAVDTCDDQRHFTIKTKRKNIRKMMGLPNEN